MHRTTLIGFMAGTLALAAQATPAAAKLSPDLSCRIALGPAAQKAVKAGLAQVDGCQKKSPSAGCNVVDQANLAKKLAPLAKKCAKAECTKALYGGDIPGSIAGAVKAAIEANSSAVLPAPSTGGDKAKTKCVKAVVKGRSQLVLKSLAPAIRSERLRAIECAPLADGSVAPNESLGQVARGAISKACGAIQGADIGVCASLPGCVVDASNLALRRLGKAIFTSAPECGDGVTQGNEQCDDGNDVDTDACTNSCRNAVCGDGITQAGVEECDDRNADDTDACLQTCVAATCGDGKVEKDVEECDDGNSDDADACKNTCALNRVACGPNGLNVTFAVANGPSNLAGVTFDAHFDHTKVSIPGQGPDALDRTTVLIPDPETDDLIVVNDELFNFDTNTAQDPDTVRVVYVKDQGSPLGTALPNGPLVTFRYDCEGAVTFLPADFGCAVGNASSSSGSPLAGVTCAASSVVPAP